MKFFNFKKKSGGKTPKSAYQRKIDTEKLLKSLDIPFISHLPTIEEEEEVTLRKPTEVAKRILVLTYLGYISEVPKHKEKVIKYLKETNLWLSVSPNEKELFLKEELTEQEFINVAWRIEAVWILLWSINKVGILDLPVTTIDHEEALEKLPPFLSDPSDFINKSKMRPMEEILDMSDLLYRLHWACRNAKHNNHSMPYNLNLSITMERHYVINWITYYSDEWDEVTTDT